MYVHLILIHSHNKFEICMIINVYTYDICFHIAFSYNTIAHWIPVLYMFLHFIYAFTIKINQCKYAGKLQYLYHICTSFMDLMPMFNKALRVANYFLWSLLGS